LHTLVSSWYTCTFIGYILQEVSTFFLQPCLIAVLTKKVTFPREISSVQDACIFSLYEIYLYEHYREVPIDPRASGTSGCFSREI